MTSTLKSCSRCEAILPPSSFLRGNQCPSCRREARERWKRENPSNQTAHRQANRGQLQNATAHAKLHCDHVAQYTKRAIERFERKTGNEAPPELTALYQLASTLRDQQESRITIRRITTECATCGAPLIHKPRGTTRKYCSQRCKSKSANNAKSQRNGAIPETTKRDLKWAKIQGHRQYRNARHDMILLLRLHGYKWQDISDRFQLSGPGHAYLIVNPQQKA